MVVPPKKEVVIGDKRYLVEDSRRNDIYLPALFGRGEHGIYMYYGRIGQGKTYAMTADILEALSLGRVVYTNYPIRYDGYDQEWSLFWLFIGLIGLKKKYYAFPKENLHHIDIDEDFHDNFAKLNNCIVALDEGYVVFDSYEQARMSMKKRKNVYHTRHFDRSIWLTSQRPTAVHVSMRSQVNVFYKVDRLIKIGSFVLFRRREFDLATDETVSEVKPLSTKLYLGKKSVFSAYDTKYLRYGANDSQQTHVDIKVLTYGRRLQHVLLVLSAFPQFLKKLGKRARKGNSLGGNSEATSIKNTEGLNTVGVGGSSNSTDRRDSRSVELEVPF